MRNPEIADSGFLFVDGVEDIEDVDEVLDTDTARDVGADGVVSAIDLPDEMIGVEVNGGELDFDGAKHKVEGDDDDNVRSSSEARDVVVAKGVN